VVFVQQPGDLRPSLCNEADMFELPITSEVWQGYLSESSRHHDRHECLSGRLGGSLQQRVQRGTVVLRKEKPPHQSPGGSFTVQAFTKDKKDLNVHLQMDNNTAHFYVGKMGKTRSPRSSE